MHPLCAEALEKLGLNFASSKDPRLKRRLEAFYMKNSNKIKGLFNFNVILNFITIVKQLFWSE